MSVRKTILLLKLWSAYSNRLRTQLCVKFWIYWFGNSAHSFKCSRPWKVKSGSAIPAAGELLPSTAANGAAHTELLSLQFAFGSPSGAAETRKGNLTTTLFYCCVSCFKMLCCESTPNLLPISSPCKSVCVHPDKNSHSDGNL